MKKDDEIADYRARLLRKLKEDCEQKPARLNIWPIDDGLKIPEFKGKIDNP